MNTTYKCIAVIAALLFAASVHAATFYVDASAPSGGSGQSWTSPFNTLSDALNEAQDPGDVILVAQGTYSPGGLPSSTFAIPEGVAIYGGFQNGDDELSDQNTLGHPTILDGGGNVAHIVTLNNANTRIDGFTITAGNNTLNSSDPNAHGGGVRIDGQVSGAPGTAPRINNCIITGNRSSNRAGGIYIETASPIITKCEIADNTAITGAGIAVFDVGGNPGDAEPYFVNCTIRDNGDGSTGNGGGFGTAGTTTLHLHNCVFFENQANTGGAMYLAGTSGPLGASTRLELANCTIADNTASIAGRAAEFQKS